MGRKAKVAAVNVVGRRWFQRTYGNTYHSVRITITYRNGTHDTIDLGRAYGYGDYYMQRAADELERIGLMPGRKHYPNGGAEPAWQYFDTRKIPFFYTAHDVPRQKDL